MGGNSMTSLLPQVTPASLTPVQHRIGSPRACTNQMRTIMQLRACMPGWHSRARAWRLCSVADMVMSG